MKEIELIEKTVRTGLGTYKTGKEAELKDVLIYFKERSIVTQQFLMFNSFNRYELSVEDPNTLFTKQLLEEAHEYKKQQRINSIHRDIHHLKEELKMLEDEKR